MERLDSTTDKCYCAHCETEGIRFPSFLHSIIAGALERGITICPLGELILEDSIPGGRVGRRSIRGRFEPVAWQEEDRNT